VDGYGWRRASVGTVERWPAASASRMDWIVMLRVSRTQAVNFRLSVNNLSNRLAAGSYVEAAYVGLQDTAPRDALLGIHARVGRVRAVRLGGSSPHPEPIALVPRCTCCQPTTSACSRSVACRVTPRRDRRSRIWPRMRAAC